MYAGWPIRRASSVTCALRRPDLITTSTPARWQASSARTASVEKFPSASRSSEAPGRASCRRGRCRRSAGPSVRRAPRSGGRSTTCTAAALEPHAAGLVRARARYDSRARPACARRAISERPRDRVGHRAQREQRLRAVDPACRGRPAPSRRARRAARTSISIAGLDRVAREERDRAEQVAAGGHLAGERLPERRPAPGRRSPAAAWRSARSRGRRRPRTVPSGAVNGR